MRVKFMYRNHRGEVNERDVTLRQFVYRTDPGWGYEPGWFWEGYDHSRSAPRIFAVNNIIPNSDGDLPVLTVLVELP